ncbi:hypothetical protein ACWED2_12670 [Amycolatopsis sp. NPDC005003]
MDVSTLHTLTEDLAAFLSEITRSDLARPVEATGGDVSDLYRRLINANTSVAAAISGTAISGGQWIDPITKAAFDGSSDIHGGCGLEVGYRQTAHLMENAFESVTEGALRVRGEGIPEIDVATLYEDQISSTVIHTWDVAHVLGLPHQPAPEIAQRMLQAGIPRAARTPSPHEDATTALDVAGSSIFFDCVLKLAGRTT